MVGVDNVGRDEEWSHPVDLSQPPEVLAQGHPTHGTETLVDHFMLPELWQLHLYAYRAQLIIDSRSYDIRPGMVSLTPPGASVTFRYEGPSTHYFAHLRMPVLAVPPTDSPAGHELGQWGSAQQISAVTALGSSLPLIQDLMASAVASAAHRPQRTQADIWGVLLRLADLSTPPEDQTARYVSTALSWIESHLSEPVTVTAVAAAVGLSPDHLTRIFRRATGRTIVGHLRRRRIVHAERLLQNSTMPISAIARAVGIPDLQAFNKTCRAVTGQSPRAVRAGAAGVPRSD